MVLSLKERDFEFEGFSKMMTPGIARQTGRYGQKWIDKGDDL